jgi:TolB-like protein/DNA-binding winged helix-turn-helix (wHTH) protein
MEPLTKASLRIGAWCVDPATGQISRDGETARLELRAMRLLLCLAVHAGEIVSIDELLDQVWSEVTVTPDSVYQAVASLRRLLGDDPKQPAYIATVPRLGYRMVAKVSPCADHPAADVNSAGTSNDELQIASETVSPRLAPHLSARFLWVAGVMLLLAVGVAAWALFLHGKFAGTHSAGALAAAPPLKSIAVLPFLDLTQGMKEEEFADGMTEELIDKLNKIPGLRVPPPTSSFFYKGKQISVNDFARALGVAYVLDGSVRKSGARVRVAARLIRADRGDVVWSETYDRPFDDILAVQDDIAGDVTKALRVSIETTSDGLKNP